ncbi:hypothetical protein IU501_16860 [Nocardia otitidiscaviarum]|uniref:hypothetical protein n=1 Tax=Nocardia otitidiscaviarum TaxID=1823 RepID=UPI0004A6C838|nr:hypothetical protein [Nocardia otitidiscaviarum]MBF6134668.1 hypothetical protein [Nocardia otitidiscaviarum]MBF6485706.1 hypothetical protein [Nocardia otitidiscaviarum]
MPTATTPGSAPVGKEALVGALAAVAAAPVAAAIVAVLYRFPIPLTGYADGFGGAIPAALGSLFYLVLGGAPVLGLLGAVGGVAAARLAGPDIRRARRLTLLLAGTIALFGAIALASLELFIGAW